MKRKIFLFILFSIFIFLLFGCTEKKEPKDIVIESFKPLIEKQELLYKINMKPSLSYDDNFFIDKGATTEDLIIFKQLKHRFIQRNDIYSSTFHYDKENHKFLIKYFASSSKEGASITYNYPFAFYFDENSIQFNKFFNEMLSITAFKKNDPNFAISISKEYFEFEKLSLAYSDIYKDYFNALPNENFKIQNGELLIKNDNKLLDSLFKKHVIDYLKSKLNKTSLNEGWSNVVKSLENMDFKYNSTDIVCNLKNNSHKNGISECKYTETYSLTDPSQNTISFSLDIELSFPSATSFEHPYEENNHSDIKHIPFETIDKSLN